MAGEAKDDDESVFGGAGAVFTDRSVEEDILFMNSATTLYIAASHETRSVPFGTKLGDSVCAIINAWAWYRERDSNPYDLAAGGF